MKKFGISNVETVAEFSSGHNILTCMSKVIITGNKSTYLSVKTFPVILCHKTEQRKEGPAKMIKTCITKVRILPNLLTGIVFWALIARHKRNVKQYSLAVLDCTWKHPVHNIKCRFGHFIWKSVSLFPNIILLEGLIYIRQS